MKNNRKTPPIINKLTSLIRRIPPTHIKKQELQEELRNYKSGFNGEQSLDFFYRYLPKDKFLLLHGIRIEHDDYLIHSFLLPFLY